MSKFQVFPVMQLFFLNLLHSCDTAGNTDPRCRAFCIVHDSEQARWRENSRTHLIGLQNGMPQRHLGTWVRRNNIVSPSKVKGCEKRRAKKLVIRHEMFKRREPVCYTVAHVHRIQRCLQTWAEGAHSRRVQIARTARFKLDHARLGSSARGLDWVPSLGKDLGVASRFPGGIKSFLVTSPYL